MSRISPLGEKTGRIVFQSWLRQVKRDIGKPYEERQLHRPREVLSSYGSMNKCGSNSGIGSQDQRRKKASSKLEVPSSPLLILPCFGCLGEER